MKKKITTLKIFILLFFFISISNFSQNLLPREFLQQQTQPVFRLKHTLPFLQCNGFGSVDYTGQNEPVRGYLNMLEMANWGYAFDLDSNLFNPDEFDANKLIVDDPQSEVRKMIDLAKNDPDKYKLSTVISRYGQTEKIPFSPTECPECYLRDANNQVIISNNHPFMSPLISDEKLDLCSQKLVRMYQYIQNIAPISYATDYGEIGPFIPLFAKQNWFLDPNVGIDYGNVWTNDHDFNIYYSQKWSRFLKGLWQRFPSVLAQDGFVTAYTNDGGESRGRWWGWEEYNSLFEFTKETTKYANGQSYYNLQNQGYNTVPGGDYRPDMLSTFLYRRSTEIILGQPYGVEWTNGACASAETEYDRWTGFLKCIYVGGNLSSLAGFFGDDWGGNTTLQQLYPPRFDPINPPFYIKQVMALSRVHAIFSWIEPFTRNSDLLIGNVNAQWWGNQNLLAEFSNTAQDKGLRVMARKLKNDDKWLVIAWAMTGEDRLVEVTIPELGLIKLYARKAGTIYHVDKTSGNTTFNILDNDSMGIITDVNAMKNNLCYLYDEGCHAGESEITLEVKNLKLSILPNPNNGIFYLNFNDAEKGNYQLEIIDILGRKVLEEKLDNLTSSYSRKFDLSSEKKGIYIVTLKNDIIKEISTKLIIN